MNRKVILKYILMYAPFITGIILYFFNIYTLYSSLLLFLGGYVAIKNTFDYRKVKKNINNNVEFPIDNKKYFSSSNIGVRRIKRNIRVRKRVKH